ncbi:MAG: CoA transferase [Thermomicrobiales bacterium]
MAITGDVDGEPMKVGVAVVDVTTGLFTAVGICAALRERDIGTRPACRRQSLCVGNWLAGERCVQHPGIRERRETLRQCPREYRPLSGLPGTRQLHVDRGRNRSAVRDLCKIIGNESLADDARYATNSARVEHREELVELLQEAFLTRDAEEWLSACRESVIPSGPIRSVEEVLNSAQTAALGMVQEMPHPTAGSVKLTGIPFELSRTPAKLRTAPPTLGQHTNDVLESVLGLSEGEIADLRSRGVV